MKKPENAVLAMSYNYPVNEIFTTIQGEAKYTGTPATFIRFQGCPVGCAWCDTKHTWELRKQDTVEHVIAKESDSQNYAMMNLDEMLNNINTAHVVITGGEPCLYDLIPLTDLLVMNGKTVQIETSGTEVIKCNDDVFVTVSPKYDMAGKREVLHDALIRANEIKYPVGKAVDVEKARELMNAYNAPVWLQPLSQSIKATELCIESCIKFGFSLSIQTHKYSGVR